LPAIEKNEYEKSNFESLFVAGDAGDTKRFDIWKYESSRAAVHLIRKGLI